MLVALIEWLPPELCGIVIVTLENEPLTSVVAVAAIAVLSREKVIDVLGLNPLPLTVIWSPLPAEVALSAIVGVYIMVNVWDPEESAVVYT